MEMRTAHAARDSLLDKGLALMRQHLPTSSDWDLQTRVALTCRILYAQGHDSGLAGQITARNGNTDSYWTQAMGLGFDEITSSNLIRVNADLEVLEGDGMANPANRFHSWIYRARPDVQCIIHTHALNISALSLLEQPLCIAHMDSCMLYEEVGFLAHWPGVPAGNEEGALISEALGSRRAVLLAHHGLVVAGRTVQEACVMAVQMERTARLQIMALSAGTIHEIDPAHAREAHDWILQPARSDAGFSYLARQILKQIQPPQPQKEPFWR